MNQQLSPSIRASQCDLGCIKNKRLGILGLRDWTADRKRKDIGHPQRNENSAQSKPIGEPWAKFKVCHVSL
jgi:hypothetical protein